MPKFTHVLLLVLLNGFLGWLINQLPSISQLGIPTAYLIGMTGGCLLLIAFFTWKAESGQVQTRTNNWDWLSSLLPFVIAIFFYLGLWQSWFPAKFEQLVFYLALTLVFLGTLLPTLIVSLRIWHIQRLTSLKILYFALIGLGALLSLHFFVRGAAVQGFICLGSLTLVACSPVVATFFNRVQQKFQARIYPYIDLQFNVWADSLVSHLEYLLWEITSQFQVKYYQSLIHKFRDLRIEGFRIGLPVLDLEDVFVPLQIITEIPENIPGGMVQRSGNPESQFIWNFLTQIPRIPTYRCLAVIGPAFLTKKAIGEAESLAQSEFDLD